MAHLNHAEYHLEKQKAFFASGKTRSLEFRKSALQQLKALIEKNAGEIIQSTQLDLGKPEIEAYTGELGLILNEIKIALKNLKNWSRVKKVRTPLIIQPGRSLIRQVPYGVVLIISPWNYPFFLSLAPLVSAIAAGNCAVIKPSELSLNTSSCLASLIRKYFDPNFITVKTGGPEVSVNLIAQRPDFLFFTGSTTVGKKVMAACAEHLIPLTLELGGKNPCIVNDCTNIRTAARRIAWGKFFNAGQTCFAPDYIIVESSLKDRLVAELKLAIGKFYGKSPGKSPDYARIISEAHTNRLHQLAKGHTVLSGGTFDSSKKFVSPTILDVTDWNAPIMKEEIFGPLLPVLEYTSLQESLEHILKLGEPLTVYLFTEDPVVENKVRDTITSGSLNINTTFSHIMSGHLPFGGVGSSGMGRYRGRAGFETFSYKRSEFKRSFLFDTTFIYPPYKTSLKFLKKIMPFLF
ncbi:MAG: aldehyde dehydrogenase family protein [Fibrobacteria bacterium]|nr:aldehyde dehydrogenase family protein [Fibrobacteria bacterium]